MFSQAYEVQYDCEADRADPCEGHIALRKGQRIVAKLREELTLDKPDAYNPTPTPRPSGSYVIVGSDTDVHPGNLQAGVGRWLKPCGPRKEIA